VAAECFSLWQSIGYLESMGLSHNGQHHSFAVDAQSFWRLWQPMGSGPMPLPALGEIEPRSVKGDNELPALVSNRL
jgi:hypothetical protein